MLAARLLTARANNLKNAIANIDQGSCNDDECKRIPFHHEIYKESHTQKSDDYADNDAERQSNCDIYREIKATSRTKPYN